MKASAFVLIAGTLATGVVAQTLDTNLNERTNRNYVTISATNHTTTAKPYIWSPTVPADYAPAILGGTGNPAGVPAGTHNWRHLFHASNYRASARQFSGFTYGVTASAATTLFPLTTAYQPEFEIRPTKLNGAGPGRIPDFAATAYATVPQATLSLSAASFFYVTVTLNTAVTFTGNDLALTLKYKGGEADDIPNTQGYWSDYAAGLMTGQTVWGQDYGFASPNNTITLGTVDQATPKIDYMEEEAVIMPYSSWGYRNTATAQPLYGTNIHTVNSNLTSVAGNFGYDIDGGPSQAGGYVLVLMNIAAAPFPISFSLLGQTLELNISDPALTLGSALGYTLQLSPQGLVQGPKISLPALPALSGQYVGAEGVLIDSTLTTVTESTMAAHWRFQ